MPLVLFPPEEDTETDDELDSYEASNDIVEIDPNDIIEVGDN